MHPMRFAKIRKSEPTEHGQKCGAQGSLWHKVKLRLCEPTPSIPQAWEQTHCAYGTVCLLTTGKMGSQRQWVPILEYYP